MKRFLALLLFSFSFAARSELTQAQMTAAMVDALKQYATYSSGEDFAMVTLPYSDPVDIPLSDYLDPFNGIQNGLAVYLRQVANNLWARDSVNLTFISNVASRITAKLTSDFQDFLTRSDENNYRLPESVYSIAQEAEEIRNKFSDLMYLLNSQLDTSLGNLASYLSSIDSRLNGIDSQLQSALNTSLSTLESVLRDVSSYAGDIYTYLGDQEEVLQAISDHTDDTATGVAAVMNWLQYSFDSVLVQALADVTLAVDWSGHPDHFVVTVDNMPSNLMENTEAYLSNLVGQAKMQGSNVQDIATTVSEWFPIATNFYASATATREQLDYTAFETNSIFTNYVAETDYYESETNDFVAPDFDSVYDQTDESVPNPWDGGDVVAVNVGREAESFFDPGTPEFNTEVVLMGSNDMHLPRIAFSVESVFGASDEARRWGAIMQGLWFFIGFALRFYMIGTWIIWFTQLEK